jgi:hypothetical protein
MCGLDARGDASHQIDVDNAVAHREGVVATRDIDIGCGGFLERERGDWHDTLLTASAGGGTTVTVRMQTDTFTGKAVVHCHILEHEDRLVTSVTSRRWYAAWHPFLGVAVRVRCGENHSKISSEHPSSQLTGYKEQHLWLNLFVSHDVQ